MLGKPEKEHEWLNKLLGDWTVETEAQMGPDSPPQKFRGQEGVRSLGGFWAICESQGDMPGGGTGYNIMSLGYDPSRKKYIGTFMGSMFSHLWVYEGELDASGKVLALHTVGPSFTSEGKSTQYIDTIEFLDDDHRTLSSQALNEDGTWLRFMTAHYHRKK